MPIRFFLFFLFFLSWGFFSYTNASREKLYNKSFVPNKFSYLPPPLWWHTAGWMWVFLVQKPFKVHGKMRCAENANNGNCTHWSRIDKVVYQQAAFIDLEFRVLSEMYFWNLYKSWKMVKFRLPVLACMAFMTFNEFSGPMEAWLCNFDIFLIRVCFCLFFHKIDQCELTSTPKPRTVRWLHGIL